jgi:hypothetical protein
VSIAKVTSIVATPKPESHHIVLGDFFSGFIRVFGYFIALKSTASIVVVK